MTDRELLQQALDALISVWNSDRTKRQVETILAIRARLAQVKKEWVGLTDEEIKECAKGGRSIGISFHDAIQKAEAKLKEKNT